MARRRDKRRRDAGVQGDARVARAVARYRHVGVVAAAVVLVVGAIGGLLFFARPAKSDIEKRKLTTLPTLTWNSLWSGAYFADFALWFSDTYPAREQLASADRVITEWHGVKVELPKNAGNGEAAKNAAKQQVPEDAVMSPSMANSVVDGLYVKDNAAYSIFHFSKDWAKGYAEAMNTVAAELGGKVAVYSIVVPNAASIALSSAELADLGGTDSAVAIGYLYGLYNEKAVHAVDVVSELGSHRNEYLFFRTDQYWTGRGAYYGYRAFCAEKGLTPNSLFDRKAMNCGNYLGAYYERLKLDAMVENPDYVEAWAPVGTNEMRAWTVDGEQGDAGSVVQDTSRADVATKTSAFLMGEVDAQVIVNDAVSDDSACLLIKDGYGDFLAPWLVDHYHTLYVCDFLHLEEGIANMVAQNKVNDVVFCNGAAVADGGVAGPVILNSL